jgi:hypothetical protein
MNQLIYKPSNRFKQPSTTGVNRRQQSIQYDEKVLFSGLRTETSGYKVFCCERQRNDLRHVVALPVHTVADPNGLGVHLRRPCQLAQTELQRKCPQMSTIHDGNDSDENYTIFIHLP